MTVIYPSFTSDNCNERASIIYVHGGGYAHQPGNNSSSSALDASIDMAQRGYVVCLINYRKGWDIRDALNSFGLGPLLPGVQSCPCENGNANCNPFSFMKTTYTMGQDTRAAHRKLLNEKQVYGVDEDLVFYMGASTGAVGVLHASFGADDMPDYEDDDGISLETHLGGIDDIGETIDNGSTFNIAGVSTIAGAIKDGSWIESSDNIPVMFNHTTLDEAVQYCNGPILNMNYFIGLSNERQHLTLDGPGRLYKDILCLEDSESKTKAWLRTHKGLYHSFTAPLGSIDPSDNCDELATLELVQKLNSESMKEVILENEIVNNHKLTEMAHVSGPCNIIDSGSDTPCSLYEPCDLSTSISAYIDDIKINIFPNPSTAGNFVNITSTENILSVEMFDIRGKKMATQAITSIKIPQEIPTGIYYLRINFKEGALIKKLLVID